MNVPKKNVKGNKDKESETKEPTPKPDEGQTAEDEECAKNVVNVKIDEAERVKISATN